MAGDQTGIGQYVEQQFRGLSSYGPDEAVEATRSRFDKEQRPGSSRLLKYLAAINDSAIRHTLIDVAANPVFRAILDARRLEVQKVLTNIPYEIDDKLFKQVYSFHHIELEVYSDILELLGAVQDEIEQAQQQQGEVT